MSGTVVALAALCLTLLTTLVAIVWRASRVVASLESARDQAVDRVLRLETKIAVLDHVPLQGQRIETLETNYHEVNRRIDGLWRKVFSHDKHLAVTRERIGSRPDPAEVDTDPPPGGEDPD